MLSLAIEFQMSFFAVEGPYFADDGDIVLQQEASLFHFDAEFLQVVVEGNFLHEGVFGFGRGGGEEAALSSAAIVVRLIIF